MLRDLLSSRAILAGLVFFVLVIAGIQLYSWHTRRTTEAELEQANRTVQARENKNEARPAQVVKVLTENETRGFVDTPDENTDTPMSMKTDALPNEPLDFADAFLPDDFASEATPVEDVPVSPHGFGSYPEVPHDFPLSVDWTDRTVTQELLMRVMIKAWSDGERFISGSIIDGKVRLNYPNTVYVQNRKHVGPKGNVLTSGSVSGAPDVKLPPPGEDYLPDVRVIDFDSAGIDPYKYLDLPQKESN